MTNPTKTTKITGHLYNGGNIPLETFLPVLDRESGLILVVGSAGRGKTTLINRLVECERTVGKQRELLSLSDAQVEIHGINHFVIPTWHSQPKIQSQYKNYTEWQKEGGLEAIDETLEKVYEEDPSVVVIDEIRDALVGTIAVALARQGYIVIAGIHGNTSNDGKNQLSRCLEGSTVFKDFADGYEDVSGYGDDIVDIVLEESLLIDYLSPLPEEKKNFPLRDILIESYT